MKKLFTLATFFFCFLAANSQSVAVNTDGSSADASAMLDVKSANKGILVPRMTTVQRTTIVTPASGLLVYDTDVKSFWYYNGVSWTNIAGAGGGGNFTLPFDATVNTPGTAFKIVNSTTAIEGSSTNNAGVYGFSENGSGVNGTSAAGFGILASSSQATAIRAFSSNANPTIYATNSNATGVAISGNSSLYDAVLGTSAGASKAGVRGEATGTSGVGVFGTATAASGYGVRGVNAAGTGVWGFSNTGYGVLASSNGGVGLRTSSTSGLALDVYGKMRVLGTGTAPGNGYVLTSTDNEGNVDWKPINKIAFRATGVNDVLLSGIFPANLITSSTSASSVTKVEFRNESYDRGNNYTFFTGNTYSSSANTFSAPVSGVYHFDAAINFLYDLLLDLREIEIVLMLKRNGTTSILAKSGSYINHVDNTHASISTDVHLNAGDIIWIAVRQYNLLSTPTSLTISNEHNYFTGHIVFAD